MIVSVHQPHFLPWMGYVNKALRSEAFVWLHSVQYRKNYYQNRTRIKNTDGTALWLTLPVHAKFGMTIDQVTVADPRWRDRIRKTLEQCYRKADFFSEVWGPLEKALAESGDQLDEVNWRTFEALMQTLGAQGTRVVRAGDMGGTSEEPTERLVEICRHLGATAYIAGKGGQNYLRTEAFEAAGIRVIWQKFDPAALVYRQRSGEFLPGLSVVDCLFNEGPVVTREKVLSAWAP